MYLKSFQLYFQDIFEDLSQVKAEKTLGPRVLYTSVSTPFSVFEFLFYHSVPVFPCSDQMNSNCTWFFAHDPNCMTQSTHKHLTFESLWALIEGRVCVTSNTGNWVTTFRKEVESGSRKHPCFILSLGNKAIDLPHPFILSVIPSLIHSFSKFKFRS